MHDKVTWPSQISSWSFWLSWLLNDVANATMLHCVAFKCSNDAKKKVWIYISTWYPMKIIQKLGSNGLCHQATLSCLQYIILIRAMIFGYSLWDEIYLKNRNKNSKRMLCQLFSCIHSSLCSSKFNSWQQIDIWVVSMASWTSCVHTKNTVVPKQSVFFTCFSSQSKLVFWNSLADDAGK